MSPQPSLSLQSRQNTHTNGKSSRGDLRRKLRYISQSDVLSSSDGGVDIREHNGCLTDIAIWTSAIQKHDLFIFPLLKYCNQCHS